MSNNVLQKIIDKKKLKLEKIKNEISLESINDQIEKMIENKYKFIRYNGLREKKLDQLVEAAGGNPFSNKIIVEPDKIPPIAPMYIASDGLT